MEGGGNQEGKTQGDFGRGEEDGGILQLGLGRTTGGGEVEWPVRRLCSILGRGVVGEFCSCWAQGHVGGLGWVLSGWRRGFATFWEGCCQRNDALVADNNVNNCACRKNKIKLNRMVLMELTDLSSWPVGPSVHPV